MTEKAVQLIFWMTNGRRFPPEGIETSSSPSLASERRDWVIYLTSCSATPARQIVTLGFAIHSSINFIICHIIYKGQRKTLTMKAASWKQIVISCQNVYVEKLYCLIGWIISRNFVISLYVVLESHGNPWNLLLQMICSRFSHEQWILIFLLNLELGRVKNRFFETFRVLVLHALIGLDMYTLYWWMLLLRTTRLWNLRTKSKILNHWPQITKKRDHSTCLCSSCYCSTTRWEVQDAQKSTSSLKTYFREVLIVIWWFHYA